MTILELRQRISEAHAYARAEALGIPLAHGRFNDDIRREMIAKDKAAHVEKWREYIRVMNDDLAKHADALRAQVVAKRSPDLSSRDVQRRSVGLQEEQNAEIADSALTDANLKRLTEAVCTRSPEYLWKLSDRMLSHTPTGGAEQRVHAEATSLIQRYRDTVGLTALEDELRQAGEVGTALQMFAAEVEHGVLNLNNRNGKQYELALRSNGLAE